MEVSEEVKDVILKVLNERLMKEHMAMEKRQAGEWHSGGRYAMEQLVNMLGIKVRLVEQYVEVEENS